MATSKKPRYDLPVDRPASFDEEGHHVALNPADVSGPWRRARDAFYVFLIIIFLGLPWTRFAGHQTVLLDIPNRRFALFGITFWAHDLPMVFFVLGILTVGLTFVTVTWGRIWCGWACPQTVFIDRVYRRIERWIEGNHIQRIRLSEEPMSWNKLWKKSLKWFLFWFVSTNIAHSFTAYFIGAERLLGMSLSAPWENMTPFIFVTALTGILMFDFGWFREQFCMIMCPYGRFQSVLMDGHSLAVMYDERRGEPRKGTEPPGVDAGDCVACYRCVAVCPTGIDIRRGIQMECVACTACIDACDEIMVKVGKPKGLIRYSSEEQMKGARRRLARPASVAYGIILGALMIGFFVSVAARHTLDVKFIRALDTPYTTNTMDDGSTQVINHYRAIVKNNGFHDLEVDIGFDGDVVDSIELVAATYPIELAGGQNNRSHVFFKFPGELTERTGKHNVRVRLSARTPRGHEVAVENVVLVGPFK
jgi:cytochrome c oxidase accessory protein FixG